MGCDIHIVIQRQDADGWHEVPYQKVYANIGQTPVNGYPVEPEGFTARNYDLFAVLADVRNGRGFAGIKMGDGWPSIAPNRGCPEGFNPESVAPDPQYKDEGPRYMGDHSFTWISLDELKAFAWDSVVSKLYGCVTGAEYERLSAVGDAPDSYCGGTSGPGIRVYEPADYLAAKGSRSLVEKPYVRMSWHESARAATYDWPGTIIPWLDSLADGKPLRLVIGFDS